GMKQMAFEIELSEHPVHGFLFSWVRIGKQETTILKATLLVNILVGLILLVPEIARGAETLQKIRIGFPSLAFSYMPFYVAKEKGLLKKHELEAEYIQMRTTIQPQAVINGNINFFPSVSTGISAAVSGLPLVVVLSFCDGSPWVLVTGKEINKPQDLMGKKVGMSAVRAPPHCNVLVALKLWRRDENDR